MVIYLDLFILENFIVNYFLIHLTLKITQVQGKTIYKSIGALIGAIYSISIILFNSMNITIIKFLIAFIMCAISCRTLKKEKLLKVGTTFIVVSMVMAGICIMIEFMLGGQAMISDGFMINFTYKKLILSMMVIALILDRTYMYLKDRSMISNFSYEMEIIYGGKKERIKAFFDSGNALVEPVTLTPVVVVEREAIQNIRIPREKFYNIPYKVVSGEEDMLKAFVPDIVRVYSSDGVLVQDKKIMIALTDVKLSKVDEFNALLSRGVFE